MLYTEISCHDIMSLTWELPCHTMRQITGLHQHGRLWSTSTGWSKDLPCHTTRHYTSMDVCGPPVQAGPKTSPATPRGTTPAWTSVVHQYRLVQRPPLPHHEALHQHGRLWSTSTGWSKDLPCHTTRHYTHMDVCGPPVQAGPKTSPATPRGTTPTWTSVVHQYRLVQRPPLPHHEALHQHGRLWSISTGWSKDLPCHTTRHYTNMDVCGPPVQAGPKTSPATTRHYTNMDVCGPPVQAGPKTSPATPRGTSPHYTNMDICNVLTFTKQTCRSRRVSSVSQ